MSQPFIDFKKYNALMFFEALAFASGDYPNNISANICISRKTFDLVSVIPLIDSETKAFPERLGKVFEKDVLLCDELADYEFHIEYKHLIYRWTIGSVAYKWLNEEIIQQFLDSTELGETYDAHPSVFNLLQVHCPSGFDKHISNKDSMFSCADVYGRKVRTSFGSLPYKFVFDHMLD